MRDWDLEKSMWIPFDEKPLPSKPSPGPKPTDKGISGDAIGVTFGVKGG